MNAKHMVVSACFFLISLTASAKVVEISKADLEGLLGPSRLIKHYDKCGDYRSIEATHLPISLVTKPADSVFVYPGDVQSVSKKDAIQAASPQAQIFLLGSASTTKAQVNNRIITDLHAAIDKRSQEKFDNEFRPFFGLNNPTVYDHLGKIRGSMFANALSIADKNKLLLTFYPDIEADIANEDPVVRPLLCHMQRQRHFHHKVQRWSNILVFIAASLGISAITVTSMGIALPPITILAGITGVVVGARDAVNGSSRLQWIERTSQIALQMRALISKGRKSQDFEVHHIATEAIDEERMKVITKITHKKFWNRLLIAAGLITIGVNQINFVPIAN